MLDSQFKGEKTGKHVNGATIQSETPYEICKIEDAAEFESLRDEWDILLAQSSNKDIFLTWEWLFSWWKYFGKDAQLWLVTVRTAQELVGIAPLMLTKKKKFGIEYKVLCSIGIPETDVGGFIVKGEDRGVYQAICDFLISRRREWDVLMLEEVENNQAERVASIFTQNKYVLLEEKSTHYCIFVESDWFTYFNQLSKKNRHEFRRKARRVEETYEKVTFVRHVGEEITEEDLQAMFAVNQVGHFPYFFASGERQQFHRDLLQHMSNKGWPEVSLLYLNDTPAAFGYGFNYANRLEVWRIGFDTAYCNISIGTVLLNWIVEDSFKRNYQAIDFLRGAEDYKTRWNPQNKSYWNYRLVLKTRWKPLLIAILLPRLARYVQHKLPRLFSRSCQRNANENCPQDT